MRRVSAIGLLDAGMATLVATVVAAGLLASVPVDAHAQGKRACDLVTRADVEAILGAALGDGNSTSDGGTCTFTNAGPHTRVPPAERRHLNVNVSYAPAPNPAAVEQWRKMIDEQTYQNPVELPGIGDAAFLYGSPQYATVTVFTAGTTVLKIEGKATPEQAREIALKALGGPARTGYVYGTPRAPLPRPALAAATPGPIDQLKRDLTAKADAGSIPAQLALAKVYEFGTIAADGSVKPDHAGAAYWYTKASDAGDLEATYRLALLHRDGLGVPANPQTGLELLRTAALGGYAPAMVPLAYAYNAARTPVSPQRLNYWAQQAAEKGDPAGHTLVGYLWNKGQLGGGPPYYYKMAMTSYLKGVEGGDCVAMMNIGGLYFNGDGVPQDRALAQSWFAKAEACQSKDLDWLRAQAAKYRQKAASGKLPALREERAETAPKPAAAAKLSESDRFLRLLMATIAIGAALEVAAGAAGGGGGDGAVGTGSVSSGGGGYRGSSGSTTAPVRHCRQVQVGSFSTAHGKGAISPMGATTTVCD
jgi:TPR repeat protein